MKLKHTPGPWKLSNEPYPDGSPYYIIQAGHGSYGENGFRLGEIMAEADARLIAAAPDLLTAAQTVLAGLNARIDAAPDTAKPVFNGIAELHDAINKAISAPIPAKEPAP